MTQLTDKILQDCYTKQAAMTKLREKRDEEGQKMGVSTAKGRRVLEKDFAEAEKEVRAIEPVVIFLAREADPEVQNLIGQKVRSLAKRTSLVEFKIDPTLIAGCALSFKGRYKDYSLRAKLEEKNTELEELFRNT